MDDVGGAIKNAILRKDFSDAAMKFVPFIITVYLPKSDEIVEPESIHQAPSIPEIHSIHKFVRQISDRRLQYRIFQDGGRPGSLSHSVVQKS